MDCGDICPFSHNFKAECHNFLRIDKDYGKVNLFKPIGDGFFSETYLVDMDGIKLLKYIDLNITFVDSNESRMGVIEKEKFIDDSLNREICNQNIASQYGISPKIYTYWKCGIQKKAVIIMEYIQGKTLSEYIKTNKDYISIYLGVIRVIFDLNSVVRIIHNDMHLDNILISADKIYIIDFGKSTKSDITNINYSDLLEFTITFSSTIKDYDFSEYIRKYRLDTEKEWNLILSSFSSSNEIIDYLLLYNKR